MNEQNFKNHRRFHPPFHYVLSLLLLAALAGTIFLLVKEGFSLTSLLNGLLVVILIIMFFLIRTYPLKAQDRAIRAEENLRHYVLTGKLLDSRLAVGQIIALRFAGDSEFPELSQKAASENLTPDEIKKTITSWKADHYRI